MVTAGQPAGENGRLRVSCTTTALGAVVQAVGGNRVEVQTIIPFGMCPGHFDVTPAEADRIRNADLILWHGFERFLDGVETGPATRTVMANVKGNWMIPAVHKRAVADICAVLTELRPGDKAFFEEQADLYSRRVQNAADPLKKSLEPLRGTPVVCSAMSRDLAESMGLRVVAVFARDEDISVKTLHQILTHARAAGASLVVDNIQSSGKIGRMVAKELDVPFVMLSNFPEEEVADNLPYLTALSNNCSAVLRAFDDKTNRE
jgi:ABC-type Zn uptake system ZnuABC Zn-binding protein ZnuA